MCCTRGWTNEAAPVIRRYKEKVNRLSHVLPTGRTKGWKIIFLRWERLGNFSEQEVFFQRQVGQEFFFRFALYVSFTWIARSARFVWLLFLMQSKALCDYLPRVKNNEVKQFKSVALPGPCAQETQSTLPSDAQRCGWTLLREPCKSSCPHPKLDLKHMHKLC